MGLTGEPGPPGMKVSMFKTFILHPLRFFLSWGWKRWTRTWSERWTRSNWFAWSFICRKFDKLKIDFIFVHLVFVLSSSSTFTSKCNDFRSFTVIHNDRFQYERTIIESSPCSHENQHQLVTMCNTCCLNKSWRKLETNSSKTNPVPKWQRKSYDGARIFIRLSWWTFDRGLLKCITRNKRLSCFDFFHFKMTFVKCFVSFSFLMTFRLLTQL